MGPLDTFDLAHLSPMIATNYEAPVRTSYVFARAMKAAGSGSIVNISSIGAHLTAAGVGIYGGLKKALEMTSEALRIELAGSGVRVGLIAPGTTATEIFADMKSHGEPGWDEYITPLQPEMCIRDSLRLKLVTSRHREKLLEMDDTRLMRREPAINGDQCAIDEDRFIGSQKRDNVGDIPRRAKRWVECVLQQNVLHNLRRRFNGILRQYKAYCHHV